MAKCSCGFVDNTNAKYCPKCGALMPEAIIAEPQTINNNQQQGTYQQPQQGSYQQQGTYQQPQQNNYQQQGTYQQPQQNNYQQQGTYQQPQQDNYQQQNSYQQQTNYQQTQPNNNAFTNTDDHTADYSADDISANKTMAILSYIGILVLIPIFAAKDSPYAKFHANQGLVLFIFGVASSVLQGIARGFWFSYSYFFALSGLISFASWAIGVAVLVLMILGIINAASNNAKELPIIGKIKIIK